MSQPSMPFTGTAADDFFKSFEQEAYAQSEFDESIGESPLEHSVLPSKPSDALDDPDHSYHSNSSCPSTVSLTDFSNYGFGQQTPPYPLRNVSTRHPYPIGQQQTHAQLAFNHRTLPFRAHTNITFELPSQPTLEYHRRRSLSHNDVDRIAAPPNPTFMRLQSQVARGRSITPEEWRSGPHVRSTSHGRPLKDNVSHTLHNSPLTSTCLTPMGTPIGTPLNEDIQPGRKRARTPYTCELYGEYNDPFIRPLTNLAQLAHSRRIIEVGAMAVRKHNSLDPMLNDEDALSMHERVIKKLEEVERYLRQDEVGNKAALKGCETILEALMKKANVKVKVENGEEEAGLEVPSAVMSMDDMGLFGGCYDENDLMGLMMREIEGLE
jgi:hypothetical protein